MVGDGEGRRRSSRSAGKSRKWAELRQEPDVDAFFLRPHACVPRLLLHPLVGGVGRMSLLSSAAVLRVVGAMAAGLVWSARNPLHETLEGDTMMQTADDGRQ